jgi:nucleoside-diphosphate-sugar epimerase
MNKVLITGASGFVGKNLVKYFLQKEIETLSHSRSQGEDYNLIDYEYLDSQNIGVILHLAGKAHDLRKVGNKDEFYEANTKLTKNIFDVFLASKAKIFITLSSVKAVADQVKGDLTEEFNPNPLTHYGKSKLKAEKYIFSKPIPQGKRVYILRPCMIHGHGNKGNLNLLYKLVIIGFPWPLAAFDNKRSYCGIDNLCFIIKELIERNDIPSGIYNVADDDPVSTNDLIQWIAEAQGKRPVLLSLPKVLIKVLAQIGDNFSMPFNSEKLQKLTDSYIVSNKKIKQLLAKPLPLTTKEGFIKTFQSFNKTS